jgi:hypothetical protein
MPRVMDGGSDVVSASADDLRTLGATANRARQEIEDVQRAAGSIIGGLDGRGWDSGAVVGRCANVRGQLTMLAATLALQALDLQKRAVWVEASRTVPALAVRQARRFKIPSTRQRAI